MLLYWLHKLIRKEGFSGTIDAVDSHAYRMGFSNSSDSLRELVKERGTEGIHWGSPLNAIRPVTTVALRR